MKCCQEPHLFWYKTFFTFMSNWRQFLRYNKILNVITHNSSFRRAIEKKICFEFLVLTTKFLFRWYSCVKSKLKELRNLKVNYRSWGGSFHSPQKQQYTLNVNNDDSLGKLLSQDELVYISPRICNTKKLLKA